MAERVLNRTLVSAALAAFVLFSLWPVLHAGFTNFDDGLYVSENPHVQRGLTGESLRWAWTTRYAANWHPVTWTSHMLDWRLYGSAPRGHHATSLALHVINTLLLFLLFLRMTGSLARSALVAALFGVHPLHVESVAWIAERKDVLSTFFWFAAAHAYVRFTKDRSVVIYAALLLATGLGLAAKPMLVTLPLTLLLLDYWPLGRSPLSRIGEKLPLLALALLSCIVTIWAQGGGGALASMEQRTLSTRIANAIVASADYLWKAVRPVDLAAFYPYPASGPPGWQAALAAVVLAAVSVAVVAARRKRPYLLFGWLWYVVTLAPVVGLVQVGSQSMADRYTYVPLIGIFVMVTWGIADALSVVALRPGGLRLLAGLTAAIIMLLSMMTRAQARTWHDSVALWEHAIAATGRNAVAQNNLALALAAHGERGKAEAHYLEAIREEPGLAKAYNNLGSLSLDQGRVPEAIARLQAALAIDPRYAAAHYNLGSALASAGKFAESVPHYEASLAIDPSRAEAHDNLGIALVALDRVNEALFQFEAAARLDSINPRLYLNWGLALARQKRWTEAAGRFAEGIRLRPGFAEAHYNLAAALFFQQDFDGAWREVQLARRFGFTPPGSFIDALSAAKPEPRPAGD